MAKINKDVAAWFKSYRQHQMDTYGGSVTITADGVHQYTGGGAAYGFHAVAAYNSARRTIHFRKTMKADMAAYKKRSRAAKRGWKKRNI